MDVGTNVWIKTNDAAVWAAGEVIDYQHVDGLVQVRRFDTGDVVIRHYPGFDDELCLRNISTNFLAVSSLTNLEHLHEAALLQALNERFAHDEIYTSIGDILVALNPLKALPKLYSDAQLDAYKHAMTVSPHRKERLPPHVFAIGGKAYSGLLKAERHSQSILVSGESGSGKTESTKFLMRFLISAGRGTTTKTHGAVEIGRRILQTNPILESFGNAQTIRNDNSSRFGKFIKIQFGDTNEIVGAQIVSYLLEKVRLLHQNPGERSFHIFYELLEGADSELLKVLGLQKGGTYELLNSYGPKFARQRAVSDKYAQLYRETVRAFDDTGVDKQERLDIFKILAALLHLGNVNFTTLSGQDETTAVTTDSRFHLEKCAELLGVSMKELETLLSSRAFKAGMEVMVLKHNSERAKEICQSLAKAVYGRLFSWLVRRLSDEINYFDAAISNSDEEEEEEELATIGILDIFGFESLNRNGFEQLCINYANERLQAQFNEFVFVREQQVYIAEEIDWKAISYPSNAACLALFDDKSNGLFSLLDQECLMPKGSNQALSTKFYRYHGEEGSTDAAGLLQQSQFSRSSLSMSYSKCSHRTMSIEENVHEDTRNHTFSASKMERVNHQFVVHHFAGRVCYNVDQFVEKNTDALPADASSILSSSSNEVVVALGADDYVDIPGADNETSKRRRCSTLRAPSVSAQFKSQLDRLIVQIGRTEPHYIRCLRPNELKKAGIFDRERMVEQMRSVGVLEAVRIARHGYSVRLSHASFVDRFSEFKRFMSVRTRSTKMNNHDLAQALVTVLVNKVLPEGDVDRIKNHPGALIAAPEDAFCRKDVQVGKTLVFCKSDTYNHFCRYRLELRNRYATVLQKHYRGYRRRVWFQKLRDFAVHVQAIVRGFLGRRRVDRLRQLRREKAATRIQLSWKGFVARRTVAGIGKDKLQLAKAIRIQTQCRRWLTQHKRKKLIKEKCKHAAATVIQRQSKKWLTQNLHTTVKLQRFQLKVAFGKFRRACLASQTAGEIEAEQTPSDGSMASPVKRHATGPFGRYPYTVSSSEQEDSSTGDDRMEPLVHIVAPTSRRTHSRQRSRASGRHHSRASSSHVNNRNSLLENEILRLQQMLVEQQGGREDRPRRDQHRRSLSHARPQRNSSLNFNHEHSTRAPHRRPDHRRFSVSGALSDDEDDEVDDDLSVLPLRRARSVMPGKHVDHVSMLSKKIEHLDAKCKFLEHLVDQRNYEDAGRQSLSSNRESLDGREHMMPVDGPLYDEFRPSDAGTDVDSIIFNIQNQMDMLRQSISTKEPVAQTSRRSFSTRSSSTTSMTSFSNLPLGEAPPSLPSLPLSESQLSAGGSSHGNSRRSGESSLGTPTSSVASSFYQGPPRFAPAHFGGRGMPRIVKWARSTNCYECGESFNLFVRRHHCRMCGNSFCHEHSSRRVSVFGIGFDDEPVRVCDNCFSEYYASQEPHTTLHPPHYGFTSDRLSATSRLSGL